MEFRNRLWFLSASLVVLLSVSLAAAQSSNGDAEFRLGVEAYKRYKFDDAIAHFEQAVAKDPANIRARHYLATAYAQRYIPGADMEDNQEVGERAIEQYLKVIELTPPNGETINAVKGIAYIDLQMKRYDEAKAYYRKATELEPEDPESYYSIGVIDWTETYQPRQEERAKLGFKPEASLPAKNPNVCDMLRAKNWDKVQEGIDNLNKAIQLCPDYDDAMAYMNLMYRERADLQCGDPSARKADLATADDWVDKTIAIKKAKAEKEQYLPPTPGK
jgi:tetratricopeptide (TPR) repeat protein